MNRIAGKAAALVVILSASTAAALPTNVSFVSAGAGPNTGPGEGLCFEISNLGSPVSCMGTADFRGSLLTYQAEASARAQALRVRAAVGAIAGPETIPAPSAAQTRDEAETPITPVFDVPLDSAGVEATARVSDDWIFNGYLPGFTARMEIDVAVDGTTSVSGPTPGTGSGFGSPGFLLQLANDGNGDRDSSPSQEIVNALAFDGAVDGIYTLGVDITYGLSNDIRLALTASPGLFFLDEGFDAIDVAMDLSNTAVPTAIRVLDDEGALLPFTLQTSSGDLFWQSIVRSGPPLPDAAVPLPATLPLGLAALAGLAAAARRRRRI